MARQAVERDGFQNFVEEVASLEEGNCLELLLLLRKSFLVLDIRDRVCVLGLYGYVCLGLDSLLGSLGILKALCAKKGLCSCTGVFDEGEAKNLCCCAS